MIWIAREGDVVENSPLRVHPAREPEEASAPVPSVRISHEVGAQLLANYGVGPEIFAAQDFTARELGQARLRVNLADPQAITLNSVVTYRPGTDADLGDEIVLIYAMCEDLWQSTTELAVAELSESCPASYMLELARLLNENLIDTRRPIVFAIWGGAEFGRDEFLRWVVNPDSYAVTAPGMRLSPRVTIAIQLHGVSEGADLAYLRGSDPGIVEVLESASAEMGQPVVELSEMSVRPVEIPVGDVPYQALVQIRASGDPALVEKQGEALAFMLIRLVREDILSAD
jgi:hypothetical protein